jgi:thioredoxin reductase (NADPH)
MKKEKRNIKKEKLIGNKEIYDSIIIGSGPAGLTAAIYSLRYKLNILVIGKETGGYVPFINKIENYPGFKEINGAELINKIKEQTEALGLKIIEENVIEIRKQGKQFSVKTDKKEYESKTIIIASGTERKKLGLREEGRFLGKGISYCSTCDGPLFRNKIICVYGGGNSAFRTAKMLSDYASKVYLIYRNELKELKADPILVHELKKDKKIEFIFGKEIGKIKGDVFVKSIILNDGKELEVSGIFVEIGSVPSSYFLRFLGLKTDKNGYLVVDNEMKTNIEGIFAAGDCVSKRLRQIIISMGEGAMAAFSAYDYLKFSKN